MENSEQNLGNQKMPQYPKAGDELQKHIETVIPDGEKETIDSANAAPEQVVADKPDATVVEKSTAADEDHDLSEKEKSEAEEPGKTDSKSENDEDHAEEANPSVNKPNDAGDAIETVSN